MEFATHEDAGAAWLLKYRHTKDLTRVMERVFEIAGELPPSMTLWEKAYRQLFSEGKVSLVETPMQVPAEPAALTVGEYRRMPASTIARKYMIDKVFKSQVDALIAQRLI